MSTGYLTIEAVMQAHLAGAITDADLPMARYRAELHEAEARVIDARMLATGLQAETVRAHDGVAFNTARLGKGEQGGYAMVAKTAPLTRLFAEGAIDAPGFVAAMRFAAAGNVLFGALRVATSRFDDAPRGDGGREPEREDARRMWTAAVALLSPRQVAALTAVSRYDQGLADAGRMAGLKGSEPQVRAGARVLIMEACEALRDRWR